MTEGEYAKLAGWFGAYMERFAEPSGNLPGPLEYKRVHSYRVADNAALIAERLGLETGEVLLARAAGLLHDTGRFSQYARYASFVDADSLDHGLEGRCVLEKEVAGFVESTGTVSRLFCAVQYHNRKTKDLPCCFASAEESLLRLVRDADKLDIMRILVESVEADGFKTLPEMLPGIKLSRELSPGVLESAARGASLSIKELHTLADLMVTAAAWYYDLNFSPALALAEERRFLEFMRRQLPESKALAEFFNDLSKEAGRGRPGYKEAE